MFSDPHKTHRRPHAHASPSQVAEEYQLLLTAEAMGSSKPTTRRRHGVTPDDKSKKAGGAPDQVRPADCSYRIREIAHRDRLPATHTPGA